MTKGTKQKKHRKPTKKPQENQEKTVVLSSSINSDELQKAIVSAILEAEQTQKEKEQEQQKAQEEADLKEWRAAIGWREHTEKNWLKRKLLIILNSLRVVIKLPFIKEASIKDDFELLTMFKSTLISLFDIAQILLLMLMGIWSYILYKIYDFSVAFVSYEIFIMLPVTYIFWGLLRMVKIEVKHLEDRNMILGLFASATSVASIVIAIVSIIKGG